MDAFVLHSTPPSLAAASFHRAARKALGGVSPALLVARDLAHALLCPSATNGVLLHNVIDYSESDARFRPHLFPTACVECVNPHVKTDCKNKCKLVCRYHRDVFSILEWNERAVAHVQCNWH